MTEIVHTDLFVIIGKHPHAGELCHTMGDTEDTITALKSGDLMTFKVAIENCKHGVGSCYVAKHNLKLINRPRKQ